MITKTISHYEILQPLGEGGMGVVYRAVDTRLGRPVAVKLLQPDDTIDGSVRKRFVQEARAASALNHPHIVTIYEIGQSDGVDFIAMEYIAGSSLASLIGRSRLTYRCRARLCHSDRGRAGQPRTPPAFFTATSNRPTSWSAIRVRLKVLDFGVAKFTESPASQAIDERVTTRTARTTGVCRPRKGRSSAPPPTCRRNRPMENPRTPDRMSSRLARAL